MPASRLKIVFVLLALFNALWIVRVGYRFAVREVRVRQPVAEAMPSQSDQLQFLASMIQRYPNARHYWVQWERGYNGTFGARWESLNYDATRSELNEGCMGEPCNITLPLKNVSRQSILDASARHRAASNLKTR